MKRIIMFVLLFAALKVAGQTTGYLRFDTVKIMRQNGTCELYVINNTKDSLGLLTNVGGGLTRFIKPKMLNDSMLIVGLDTLTIHGAGAINRFGLEDNSATANRTFNANGYNFNIDSVGNWNVFSKSKTSGTDRGALTNFGFNTNNSINLWSYIPGSSTRSYGFNAYGALTQMFAAGHVAGHATYVQSDTLQVILEADPNRLYMFHDSAVLHNITGGAIDFRIRTLPETIDTSYKALVSGPNGQVYLRAGDNGGGGGGATPTLQEVTDAGNTTTNDIIVGSRTSSVGRFSVEKTYTSLNVHSFDDYSTLNPSVGGDGFSSFDAFTTMTGSVNNDHYIGYQSRLHYTASGNLTGDYGMTGVYVYNEAPGSGTITNAHGIYIRNIGQGGTITNAYGLRILPVTVGTNNFAIRSEGGKNSFVDEVMIGGHTTPIAKLDVRNSTYDQTIYCDNTKANGYAAIFNASNGSGSNVGLDITASGGTGNKGVNIGSAMGASDWNIYSPGASKAYIAGKVGIGSSVTSPDSTLQINGSLHNNAGVRFEGLPAGPGTKSVRIDANGTLSVADTTAGGGSDGNGIYGGNGTLPSDVTVSTGGNTLTVSGSNDNETSFSVTNTGTTSASAIAGTASGTTSTGVTGTSSSYIGVFGSSTSNTGVQGQSSSGVGVIGVSSTGAGLRGQINPSSSNAIENAITLLRTSSAGAGANGIGAAIQYELETATNGNSQTAGSLAFQWTDATTATRTSQFEIYGVNSATTARKAAIAGNGQWTWDTYGSGTHTGTPTGSLQVTSGGSVVEGPLVASGTWSPTLTDGTNSSGATVSAGRYTRVGNIVTFSLTITTTTSAGSSATTVTATLPVASNFTTTSQASGTNSGLRGSVTSNTSDVLNIDWTSNTGGSETITITGQYIIL